VIHFSNDSGLPLHDLLNYMLPCWTCGITIQECTCSLIPSGRRLYLFRNFSLEAYRFVIGPRSNSKPTRNSSTISESSNLTESRCWGSSSHLVNKAHQESTRDIFIRIRSDFLLCVHSSAIHSSPNVILVAKSIFIHEI
jgi:hypothetical protein